jgi:hypothetical protein
MEFARGTVVLTFAPVSHLCPCVHAGVGDWHTRTFTAARSSGAFLNGQPLRVSSTRELRDALVVGGGRIELWLQGTAGT